MTSNATPPSDPTPTLAPPDAAALRERWQDFRAENPSVRIRDAARELGVTEAQLLATGCGDTVTRLALETDGQWEPMLRAFADFGRVMALSRNEYAVHETTGTWAPLEVHAPRGMGQVLGDEIDLRLFLMRWASAFAIDEPGEDGKPPKRSVQVFDAHGQAIHKIFLRDVSRADVFAAFVERFRAADQSPQHAVAPPAEPEPPQPDDAVDREGLMAAWAEMTDTHQFFHLLRRFSVGRQQAVRLAEGTFAERVGAASYRQLFAEAAEQEMPIMVFVGNPGIVQIYSGPVRKLVDARGWFNIMDPTFTLHLREEGVVESWVVRKPTDFGVVTSLECYAANGDLVFQVFHKRKARVEEPSGWRTLIDALPR